MKDKLCYVPKIVAIRELDVLGFMLLKKLGLGTRLTDKWQARTLIENYYNNDLLLGTELSYIWYNRELSQKEKIKISFKPTMFPIRCIGALLMD